MDLQPGCPLAVAPHFHLSVNWFERLLLGSVEEEDRRYLPSLTWRAPTAEELRILLGEPPPAPDDILARSLCLLALPGHLQTTFWRMLEQASAEQAARLDGFDQYIAEVARFLSFKNLPVAPGAAFDLVLSRPEQRSIQWDMEAKRPIGLTFNFPSWLAWPIPEKTQSPRLWGGFNLGNEAVHLLYVNLPAAEIAALSQRPDDPAPATLDELTHRFWKRCPNYPLVRLRIEPGEGYRIPRGGFLVDACTLDAQGPGILLMATDVG